MRMRGFGRRVVMVFVVGMERTGRGFDQAVLIRSVVIIVGGGTGGRDSAVIVVEDIIIILIIVVILFHLTRRTDIFQDGCKGPQAGRSNACSKRQNTIFTDSSFWHDESQIYGV